MIVEASRNLLRRRYMSEHHHTEMGFSGDRLKCIVACALVFVRHSNPELTKTILFGVNPDSDMCFNSTSQTTVICLPCIGHSA